MPGPLDGVKVVEFTEIIAGPFAGMLLSDMGAEVIKVEPPWGDPWRGTQPISATESRVFMAYNRGKRSITLDLTAEAAAEVLARLIPQMDVAIVNYRPDVAARLGVDYDSLAAINPRLIYCENTAFGRQGPDSWRPGYDMILQAMTGIMTAESKVSNGAPMHVVSSPFVDTSAGLCLAWCVCAALFHRERTGRGQKVETTLLGLALAMLGMRFVEVESLDREHNAATPWNPWPPCGAPVCPILSSCKSTRPSTQFLPATFTTAVTRRPTAWFPWAASATPCESGCWTFWACPISDSTPTTTPAARRRWPLARS